MREVTPFFFNYPQVRLDAIALPLVNGFQTGNRFHYSFKRENDTVRWGAGHISYSIRKEEKVYSFGRMVGTETLFCRMVGGTMKNTNCFRPIE